MEYSEVPCECGFTPEKEKNQFEIYYMRMGSIMHKELPKKPVLRCKTCKKISILERKEKPNLQQDIFEGMPSLKEIIEKKQIPIPKKYD